MSHSGNKYLRQLRSSRPEAEGRLDVYDVLVGFDVKCPARAHAIKKLLCAGLRDKGPELKDLEEARDAIDRAIQLQEAQPIPDCVKPFDVVERGIDGVVTGIGLMAPCWEAVPIDATGKVIVYEGDAPLSAVAWKVRWSTPDTEGRYYWSRHYFKDEDKSIGWCQNAAEGDAKRMNMEGKLPNW